MEILSNLECILGNISKKFHVGKVMMYFKLERAVYMEHHFLLKSLNLMQDLGIKDIGKSSIYHMLANIYWNLSLLQEKELHFENLLFKFISMDNYWKQFSQIAMLWGKGLMLSMGFKDKIKLIFKIKIIVDIAMVE